MSWRDDGYGIARPLLFRVDAERIHRLTLLALASAGAVPPGRWLCGLASGCSQSGAGRSAVEILGLRFRNRIGLAAGFDKDGVALRGWAALGFGFVEVGTVTPSPQPGNPRPRLFRLPADGALVNRMGFNNHGAPAVARRLAPVRRQLPAGFVVGANIGRGRATPDERSGDDYLAAARTLAPFVDYLAVNVSSPNTPGLRDLQLPERLTGLFRRLDEVEPMRPLLVKLAPDLGDDHFAELVHRLADSQAAGLVLSNTSLAREGLRSPTSLAGQPGGLSGRPLFPLLLARIEHARRLAGDRFAIIASGGIDRGSGARAAVDAGADLVQAWTGLVYRGPGLIGEMVRSVE